MKARTVFWTVWALLAVLKTALAARLPLFGDEAWYWLEGQHPALAYSDLPGLTAWLIRLGVEVGGNTPLGVRWPFLLLAMLLPLQLRATARLWFGDEAGWRAAWVALAFPLIGSLGLLALPDVPMTFAAALCLHACARLVEAAQHDARDGLGAAMLGLGLAIGALSHYRFALLVLAGAIGLSMTSAGRRALHDPRVWIAIAIGAAAWLPLLAWNLQHDGAGLNFQLAERHPWQFHFGGLWFVPMQLAIASPLLLIACVAALMAAWRRWRDDAAGPWGLIVGTALVPLLVYGALAFFADRERVSFHWTLQAWLPVIVCAPAVLWRWNPRVRAIALALGFAFFGIVFAYLVLAATPSWRAALADSRWYPDNFAGWNEIAASLRAKTAKSEIIAADNFMLGAQLAFAMQRPNLPILDHPLNHKHGRAAQLALWRQGGVAPPAQARWLVVEDSAVALRERLAYHASLCERLGALPLAEVLNVDHGRKRFLRIDLAARDATDCAQPALAWIDAPSIGATVARNFTVDGWAFKDGAGIARVDITLDGVVVAHATYGLTRPHVTDYWKISRDPAQPEVGFQAQVDASAIAPGEHWLGLVLHGRDGSVEPWPEQRVRIE
jgi:4-amino-4-deoxy-L-arabinose transferase-like glycosyltransferase